MFWALKWGIVRFSSSNWSRDMTKHKNAMIANFHDFARKIRQILQNSKNWRNNIFTFIDVSPKIFELQRPTIPHFEAWNKLFWPFFIHLSDMRDIIEQQSKICVWFFLHKTLGRDLNKSRDLHNPVITATKTGTSVIIGDSLDINHRMGRFQSEALIHN